MTDFKSELKIKVSDFIRLKPYKDILLTSDAKSWLIGMAFLAMLLAVSEGIIWGYLIQNYFFLNTDTTYSQFTIPFIIGTAFAAVIWLIDAQIVNMDLSYYEKAEESNDGSKFLFIRKIITKYFWNKPSFVLLSRIAIIIISVYFTAPALTKLVLKEEVEALIEKQRFDLKTNLYKKVDSTYFTKIENVKLEKKTLENEFEKEVAGTRSSTGSKSGYGRVAKFLEKRITQKEREIEKSKADKKAEYELIDNNDFDGLKTKYNTYIEGVTTASMREMAYQQVMKDKNNRFLSNIAKTAIFLIFAAFLLFKLFQPKTVSNYYNNKMQDSHLEYRRGELDHLVTATKLPLFNDNGGMSHHKYFEFYKRIYLPTQFDDFDTVKIQSYKKKAEKIRFLKNEVQSKEKELEIRKNEKKSIEGRLDKLDERVMSLSSQKSELTSQINSLERLIQSEFNNVEANLNLQSSKNSINSIILEVASASKIINSNNVILNNMVDAIIATENVISEYNDKITKLENFLFDEL